MHHLEDFCFNVNEEKYVNNWKSNEKRGKLQGKGKGNKIQISYRTGNTNDNIFKIAYNG